MTRRMQVWWGSGLVIAAALLGFLVTSVAGGNVPLDVWWNSRMPPLRSDLLLSFAYMMNRLGGGWIAILVVPILIAVTLVLMRRWRVAIFALAAFSGTAIVVQLLKHLFGRARPADMLVHSDFGSFPSGHTANAAAIAVMLWIVFPRLWVAIAGLIWTLLMAFSRTLLSVHWLTDTVGGVLVGAGATLLIAAAVAPWLLTQPGRVASKAENVVVAQQIIRPYRPADRAALYDVCVRTADAGGDATGLFADDELWGNLFAVPYADRHPDLAWVVEAEDGRVIGYIVSTDDTDAFESWFREEWWPQFTARYPRPAEASTREERMIEYGYERAPGREANAVEFPAHLHIDLLPETQGRGLGRQLMTTLFDELTRRGVAGLHLGIDPANTGAAAFYERIGMQDLPALPGGRAFGVKFAQEQDTTRTPAESA